MLQFVLLALLGAFVQADITGTNPPNGACLCFDGDSVNIRDSACGDVIGSANSGQCYIYTGAKQTCDLSGVTYDFFRFDWGSTDGWSAGTYLNTAAASACEAGSGAFTDECLACICEIESNCDPNIGCRWDVNSDSCGPYQIKEDYYIDCGSPGSDWVSCANDMACAEQCVRAYMDRYGTYCTGGATPTCEDYARIHNGGPQGCTCTCTEDYWDKVSACCGGQTGCD
uniref:lysozyme n=1 Tax=Eisenia andrei TaxID=168636 RepID=A0A411K823_9ANNE|nr:invertebrate-type lysozyme [Eisenia andrei]